MATYNDINLGTSINGATAWFNKSRFNGQILFSNNIQRSIRNGLVNLGSNDNCVLSGTFCDVLNNEIVLPKASNKGSDVNYALISVSNVLHKGFDKTNNDISYYFYPNDSVVGATLLQQGMQFQVKANEALKAGDLLCNAYDSNEYSVKKAVTGDTAFLRVLADCEANAIAEVEVICKKVIA